MNDGLFNQRTLDAMALIGFLVSVANYEENITQSDLQEVMKSVLKDIHEHLEMQDNKIDDILMLLREGRRNE